MFLIKYSRYVLKSKSFLPPSVFKVSDLFKQISNEPLQKSNATFEANFTNKASNRVNPKEDPYRNVSTKKNEEVNVYVNVSGESKTEPEKSDQVDTSTAHYLIERKDPAEVFLHADPFDEVPGPEILKKISTVWKFLPEIGCQATVSAMLSIFNLTQKFSAVAKLEKFDSGPFDRLFRKYGPIVKLQGPLGADIVLVCKPEHVAKIFDQEGKHPVRSTLDSVEKCRSQSRRNCGGPFNISGIEWEEMRKALQEPLNTGGQRYFEAIEGAADMFVRRIQNIKSRQNEVPEDFMLEVTKWSMECLCSVVLGKSLGFHCSNNMTVSMERGRLMKAIVDATVNICKCESGFQFWRFMSTSSLNSLVQACEVIDGFVSKYIRLAQVNLTRSKDGIMKQEKSEPDLPFIENLLLNECLAPDEVLTCIVDLLLLGVNTTSSSLAFTLYFLAQNQRAQRTLFKEVKDVLPEKKTPLQYKQLSSLTYLDACINETLRLRMPMPTLTRVLSNDIILSNYRIPKGTYIVMDAQSACLREQNFEKSDKFMPERWFDLSNIQPFSFVPFGHGSRSCIGKSLAEVQLKSCIAKIVRNYQIEYNYGEINGTRAVISFPDKQLKLSFIERED